MNSLKCQTLFSVKNKSNVLICCQQLYKYCFNYRMAPEVILCETVKDTPYSYKADVWSLGKDESPEKAILFNRKF